MSSYKIRDWSLEGRWKEKKRLNTYRRILIPFFEFYSNELAIGQGFVLRTFPQKSFE